MAQIILTDDIITNKAQEVLENELVLTRNINKQYDSAFANEGGKIGDTLRIRLPDRSLVTDGAALQVQEEVQKYTTLTVQYQKHIGLSFTMADLTLKIDNFNELILQPRISQLAATVDATVAQDSYSQIWNSVGTPGTTPGTLLVLLQAMQKLNESAAPMNPRYMTVNPAANAALVQGLSGLFNSAPTISSQFKSGYMGSNVVGYQDIQMSQSIPVHTTGTRSTSDTILVNGTISTQGQSTISIDGGSGSATVTKGDVFTVAGVYAVNPQTRVSTLSLQQFVVTAANTASGGAWTDIQVQPAMYTPVSALATISAFPQDGAVITFIGAASTAYPQNLVYHKDAIAMVTCDLKLPTNTEMAARSVYNGVSLRLVKDYNIQNDQDPTRVDVLFGSKVIRPELAVRVWG